MERRVLQAVHADQLAEHGGRPGIRDEGLLEAALARPRRRWSCEPGVDPAALAAAYVHGLARNHPFVDGNKRTALLAGYIFLALNGLELDAPEAEAVAVITATADGSLPEDALAAWVRAHTNPIHR